MIRVESVDTVPDFVSLVIKECADANMLPWWRGHADQCWSLLPTMLRPDVKLKKNKLYEKNICRDFRRRAPAYIEIPPDQQDAITWLSLMQHYGLPTRLLDWTKRPLAAAWFAVYDLEEHDSDGSIWMLDPFIVNKTYWDKDVIIHGNNIPAKYITSIFQGEEPPEPKVAAIEPSILDRRMEAQQAAFTIHWSSEPLESSSLIESALLKINISTKSKKVFRDQLNMIGVQHTDLYPDIEGLARQLKGMDFMPK